MNSRKVQAKMDSFKNVRFFPQMRNSTALDFDLWPHSSYYRILRHTWLRSYGRIVGLVIVCFCVWHVYYMWIHKINCIKTRWLYVCCMFFWRYYVCFECVYVFACSFVFMYDVCMCVCAYVSVFVFCVIYLCVWVCMYVCVFL